jgi:hypothetical protein
VSNDDLVARVSALLKTPSLPAEVRAVLRDLSRANKESLEVIASLVRLLEATWEALPACIDDGNEHELDLAAIRELQPQVLKVLAAARRGRSS